MRKDTTLQPEEARERENRDKDAEPEGDANTFGGAIVFDAYAWVEYAVDGPMAEIVKRHLDAAEEVLTPASAIAELKESMLRHGEKKEVISEVISFVKSRSSVVEIDASFAELAGEINFLHKKKIKDWGMLDSMVFAVSKSPNWKNSRILTGDPHFKKFSNVLYIGK